MIHSIANAISRRVAAFILRPVFAAAMLAFTAAPALSLDVHGGHGGHGGLGGEVLGGRAEAVDGDTILLNGENIRLWGVEAPDLSAPDGAGRAARDTLAGLLGGENQSVYCGVVHRMYVEPLVTCSLKSRPVAGGAAVELGDLGEAMIESGWAIEYIYHTNRDVAPVLAARYPLAEARAREAKRGRWALPQPE